MNVTEHFLEYIKINTQSNEENQNCPSTDSQLELGSLLAEELKRAGADEVKIDEHGYVYASLHPSKGMEDREIVGFIAHMDTAPAFSGENIKPRLIQNYDGKDIVLNEEKNIVMKTSEFEHLREYQGQTLIVTDGTTLLGSDDKAGIAEIIAALECITKENIPHGGIRIAFTPDEEIGRGADLFDVEGFKADYAYTIDGGRLGELEYENFNAASMKVTVNGVNIHPGEAKNKMKNAALMAIEFNNMLPPSEIPACTAGYEGFYHLCEIKGDESRTVLSYIIRDHSMEKFRERREYAEHIRDYMNQKYGDNTVELVITDSYYNMKEKIESCMYIVDYAKQAMRNCKIEPCIVPIRGGTDGARLSYMGLPCPNLSTGGHNFHGKYEYISVESMEKMVEVIVEIVKIVSDR